MRPAPGPGHEALRRLAVEPNIWLASVRSDSRPHIVPVWFVWHTGCLYLRISPHSVKARNLRENPKVALALEGGSNPVICEGVAEFLPEPAPADVVTAFADKYDWDIGTDDTYTLLVRVTPRRWTSW